MTVRSVLVLMVALGASFSAHAQLDQLDSIGKLQTATSEIERVTDLSNTRCGGGIDTNRIQECGFDAIRKHNRKKATEEQCRDEDKITLCEKSMWKGLSLKDRVQRIMKIAQLHAGDFGVDYRAAPCIITNESVWFDPLIVAFASCNKDSKTPTTDQGLGQTIYPTFEDLVLHQGFKSKVAPFDNDFYQNPKNRRLLFDAMAMSVDLQIEVLLATMKVKLRAADGDYHKAFIFYNGGSDKETYGKNVNNCFQCMREKVPNSMDPAKAARTNVDSCLGYANPNKFFKQCLYKSVEWRFAKFEHFCKFGPPPPLPPNAPPAPDPDCSSDPNADPRMSSATNSGLSNSKTTAPGFPQKGTQ